MSSSTMASSGRPAKAPFFTVLIPTANRPRLLSFAVQTALWQTFKDFELIVSDNSDDKEQNRATMERHASDARLRYIRPPAVMNMPDHWEWASRHASGHHVVILTDRHVMRPSALERLRREIERLGDDGAVISWRFDSNFDGFCVGPTRPYDGATRVLDSRKLVVEYAKFANWRTALAWDNRLPRMLNSSYRSDVAGAIRAKHGRLFRPLYPDYASAFLFLAYTEGVGYVDCPLFMNHGNQSNGRRYLVYGDKEYISSLGDVDLFTGTPAPLRTITNGIVRDLMMVKGLVGSRYEDVEVDLVGYFMSNYSELLHMQRLGSLQNVRRLYAQWWNGVNALSSDQRRSVREYVAVLEKHRAPFGGLRRLAVSSGLDPYYHAVMGRVRRVRHWLADRPSYADVLEAAIRTDHLVAEQP